MHSQINGQKDSRLSREADNERKKIKKSRVGVNSSLLRIFIAKILAAPAVRMKGRNSYFHSPGEIRTENELDRGEQKASRTFSSE